MVRKRDHIVAATERLVADEDRPSDESVSAATGKGWDAWFELLDAWGAQQRTHTQTATHLRADLGVPGWWAQSITVSYQRSRGLRLKHQQADGFTVAASRTIGAPIETVYQAFVDPGVSVAWLGDGSLTPRSPRRDHSTGWTARFDWDDGPTRLLVTFEDKGPSKTTVAVTHERIPDADTAETTKAAWRQRLGVLKTLLES